jgi:hypothetical protein
MRTLEPGPDCLQVPRIHDAELPLGPTSRAEGPTNRGAKYWRLKGAHGHAAARRSNRPQCPDARGASQAAHNQSILKHRTLMEATRRTWHPRATK